MAKYKLTTKAADDLTGIWNYTFEKWIYIKQHNFIPLCIIPCGIILNDKK
jgi:toxin ParE1/3/4